MRSRLSGSAVAMMAAAMLMVHPDVLQAQRGPYNSRSHGPTLGVSLGGVALTTRNGEGDAKDFGGAGVQMEVGWHMLSSHFGLLVDYMSVNIDEREPVNYRTYNHIGGLGRYLFRSDRDIARPYLEIGVNRREVTARVGNDQSPTARTQSIGGVIGGGVQLFLARPVAVDIGAQLHMGSFGDWKSGGDVVSGLPELSQASAAIRLGVRFWPGY